MGKQKNVQKLIKTMSERYKKNKDEKIKMDCICPSCGTHFTKNTKAQVFCRTQSGTKCRDKYWNTIDPTKRNNRTRISPASNRWLCLNYDRKTLREPNNDERFNPDDHEHPFSSEALGQWG